MDSALLAHRFDADRPHLRAVAFRLLGSLSEAEDAVQEAWLRLSRADSAEVDNLTGWLTTVVSRICLDQLRARKAQAEESLEQYEPQRLEQAAVGIDQEQQAQLADSVGLALLVVLQQLSPAERIAFVLHDLFDLPFEEIGPVLGRNAAAARQLASRARRRVQGRSELDAVDIDHQRSVVDAFLAASREGNFDALLDLLDPEVVFTTEAIRNVPAGTVQGASTVAKLFQGRAAAAHSALVDGAVGAVVAPGGELLLVLRFALRDGRIAGIEAVAAAPRLAQMELGLLPTTAAAATGARA